MAAAFLLGVAKIQQGSQRVRVNAARVLGSGGLRSASGREFVLEFQKNVLRRFMAYAGHFQQGGQVVLQDCAAQIIRAEKGKNRQRCARSDSGYAGENVESLPLCEGLKAKKLPRVLPHGEGSEKGRLLSWRRQVAPCVGWQGNFVADAAVCHKYALAAPAFQHSALNIGYHVLAVFPARILPRKEIPYKCAFMKYLLLGVACAAFLLVGSICMAWEGFDADTADLVEIIPDRVPDAGAAIDVHIYDKDETITCLVENVTRNRSTIEVVVRGPDGGKKTLVMEYK